MCDISSIHLSLNSVKKQVVFLKVIESPDAREKEPPKILFRLPFHIEE